MNDDVPLSDPKTQRPSKGFWWTLVILFVVMPTVIMLGSSRSNGSPEKKTRVIIDSLKAVVVLDPPKHGQTPPTDFPTLLKRCGETSTLPVLTALRAIDHERQCFVDAWGRPLILRVGPKDQSFEVLSLGPDGLPGTTDDLH